ncbi:MAG: flagellar biosynthetic protein FliO [Chlamydiia bacterium]|nr:flagellar biosynthetic protein FliO [Chlamydiia bacterium]
MFSFLAEVGQEITPQIETTVSPGDYGAAFAKMFLTLTALVVLMILTYWFIRRIVQQRIQKGLTTQSIQVVEKRMISPKSTLYLIEIDRKTRVLIAESQLEIKKLETLPPNE